MTRRPVLALVLFAAAATAARGQDLALLRAAARVDATIPWMTDGFAATDPGSPQPTLPATKVDRTELLDRALKRAAAEKKTVLWYVPRIEGPQIIRGPLLDDYMRVVAFTDRRLAPMIAKRFVPLRMAASRELAERTGVKAPDWIEPALVVLRPDGTVVRWLERIRTFNAEFFRRWLNAALEAAGEAAEPDPRMPRPKDDAPDGEKFAYGGILALRRGDTADAEKFLNEAAQRLPAGALRAEALYALAHARLKLNKTGEADAAFREIVATLPDEPEAAQAAADVMSAKDTTRVGPAFHNYEDVYDPPEDLLRLDWPTTARPNPDDEPAVVRRAVRWLLEHQPEDGVWSDSRYSCCPNPRILPNVWTAATAIACSALLEWREVDPARVDAAIKRAEPAMLADGTVARGHNEECYADAFRLLYLAKLLTTPALDAPRRAAVRARLDALVLELAREQDEKGSFAHEYPNPFATAAVVVGLDRARRAGATAPDALFERAASAIGATRGPGGAFAYGAGRAAPSGSAALRNSMGRNPTCEHALLLAKPGPTDALAASFDNFERWLPRLERIRLSDFHTDGELGGFFFWHATYFTSEALPALPDAAREAHARALRDHVLNIGELDGSFVDSHELGKSYGAGMALLTLRNCIAKKP